MASVSTRPPRGKFDAPTLGESQIAAFTDHLATQFGTVDTDGVVGPVAYLAWFSRWL